MACRFIYQGKEYNQDELAQALRDMPLEHAQHYVPGVQPHPEMPFKTTWPDLALKRAITKAAQEGYDAISWTPGEQQAARYDLSKQVDVLHAKRNPDGTYVLYGELPGTHGGNTGQGLHQFGQNIPENKLADYVGKDIAEKIANNKNNKIELSGTDLKVGGEGMKAFYDKMLVDKANALGKKFGAKVEWKELPDESLPPTSQFAHPIKVPVLRLTPALKEQALKGLPLFQSAGTVGTPITGARQQQRVPRPVAEQPNAGEEGEPQARAHGGRVVAANINHNPTEAQKRSGAYAKDHVNIHGLNITIENARGSKRRGVDKDGKPWEAVLPTHYGYVTGHQKGADGDHVDVYLGPHTKSPHVFMIDQLDLKTKKFDEHKVLVGMGSEAQAVNYYKRAFSDGKGQARIGAIHHMTVAEFKAWLQHGDTTKPYKEPETKKVSQRSVGYVQHSERSNRHCSNCTMFIPAEMDGPACTLVRDPIDPAGWCRRFNPKRT